MIKTAALFASGCAALCAEVPDKWVHALAQVETGGVCRPGDRGKAKGIYQFHRAAWEQVSKIRTSHSLIPFSYSRATDQQIASEYAKMWLAYLADRLHKATGRKPRPAEVFLAHNLGFDGFKRIGFQVYRAPDARYDAAIRFENIVNSK